MNGRPPLPPGRPRALRGRAAASRIRRRPASSSRGTRAAAPRRSCIGPPATSRNAQGCSGENRSAVDNPRVRARCAATCAARRSSCGVRQRARQVVEDRQRLGRGDADALVAAVVAAGAARDRPGRRPREQTIDQPRGAVHRVARQRDHRLQRRRAREQAVGRTRRRRRDVVLPGFCEQRRGQRHRLRAAHRIAMHRQVHPAARITGDRLHGGPDSFGWPAK